MPFGLLLFIHGPTSYNDLNFFIFCRLPNLVRKHQQLHKVRFIKVMKSYKYVMFLEGKFGSKIIKLLCALTIIGIKV